MIQAAIMQRPLMTNTENISWNVKHLLLSKMIIHLIAVRQFSI